MTAQDVSLDELFREVIGGAGGSDGPGARGRCRAGTGVRCRRTRNISRAGFCPRCHRRWVRRGKPGRVEEYVELTRDVGLARGAAARRMGVCERTAWRYEADLRQAASNWGVRRQRAGAVLV